MVYWLAFALLIVAGIGVFMNREQRFGTTFDGAALLLIGGVFGFLLAAILVRPAEVPRLATAAVPAAESPAAAPPRAAATPAARQDIAARMADGPPVAAKISAIGFRSGRVMNVSKRPAVPIGVPVVIAGSFLNGADAAAATGSASATVEAVRVPARAKIRGGGFEVDVPTIDLVPGPHAVRVQFRERDNADHALEPFDVVITSPHAAAPRNTSGAAPEASVDVFADLTSPPQRNLSVDIGRPAFLLLQGWAFDAGAHQPAREVLVGIDDHTFYRATTGLRRPDVAQARSAAYLTSGFSAVLPTADFTPGHHSIAVMVSDGGARHVLPVALAVEIR